MKPLVFGLSALLATLPAAPVAVAEITAARVTVVDSAELLTPGEEASLAQATAQVSLPGSVEEVYYLTFASNDDNLNDTVRYYAADHGLQSADGEKYRDGLLIISVGMEPRRMGVYCGDTVCRDLEIYDAEGTTDSLRTAGIADAMRPLLKEEKWEQGLLRGVQAAADTGVRAAPPATTDGASWFLPTVAGGLGLAGLGIGGFFIARARREKIRTAREDYAYILAHHGDVAARLEEIDVRAHSLSSPLADDQLRRQWEQIRDKFLAAQQSMDGLGKLRADSSDDRFRRHHEQLATARAAVEEVVNAEANLEDLARMEHGDAPLRRRELTRLHQDVLGAIAEAEPALARQLEEIDARVLQLRANLQAPDFMDTYAGILGDYQVLMDKLTQQLYAADKVERADHQPDSLGSSAWHPGVGSYYLPYAVVSSWHSQDVAAASSAASSGSSTTSYSSSGFSGGGGSSSF
ncbi:DUF5129 domain-containing protein [Corynebacterium phocae]|uniref:DUF5129 domain-containing protein n=1 Tax=Corynebacterium phocae TaxID=161895 RepID=UPI0009521F16|nr:DUF5129 domain-containing protein [Corynebacterium phocae]KAA8723056.1 DUF5129 domain-containing protein [Corynebacterium phocae]